MPENKHSDAFADLTADMIKEAFDAKKKFDPCPYCGGSGHDNELGGRCVCCDGKGVQIHGLAASAFHNLNQNSREPVAYVAPNEPVKQDHVMDSFRFAGFGGRTMCVANEMWVEEHEVDILREALKNGYKRFVDLGF